MTSITMRNEMRVSPISSLNVSSVDFRDFIPGVNKTRSIFDGTQSVFPVSKKENPTTTFLNKISEVQTLLFQFRDGIGEIQGDNSYIDYLQYPNKNIKSLAQSVTEGAKTNDEKMTKITNWVRDNVEYKSDISNYGQMERWAYPVETVGKKTGDCEDGAFLIHSLGLNAGVSPDRLRTYGGIVQSTGNQLGGHGWTAYQRESDNEWVVLDWCYGDTKSTVESAKTMKTDTQYRDDYFYVDAKKTVDASLVNRVRDPEGRGHSLALKGTLLNGYV